MFRQIYPKMLYYAYKLKTLNEINLIYRLSRKIVCIYTVCIYNMYSNAHSLILFIYKFLVSIICISMMIDENHLLYLNKLQYCYSLACLHSTNITNKQFSSLSPACITNLSKF